MHLQMEIKMKAICDGRSTRRDVVQESLDMYRDVYIRTTQRMDVLKAVSGSLFTSRPWGLLTA